MEVLQFSVGPMDNNTYLVIHRDSGCAAVIDPAYDSRFILDEARARDLRIVAVLNTHTHFDHVVENAFFVAETGAPLVFHTDDLPLYDALEQQASWFGVPAPDAVAPGRLLNDRDIVEIGGGRLEVLHTPGHSPGGVSFSAGSFVIVGDVLFAGSIGRADLPGGDMDTLLAAIERELLVLPDETVAYPGHGPATTIGQERRTNPYLGGMR